MEGTFSPRGMFLHFSAQFRDCIPLAVAACCVQELQIVICLGLFSC